MVELGNRNCDEPPHVNEIRNCNETVEINRLALVRLLLMSERVRRANGSDNVAKGEAFDALGVDGICRTVEDIEL
jgi:hypothetical protein